jgi:ectoine hydroxylase-related dioxygenase (phytanoyl-CoA dioxygenase family)
LTGTGRFFYTSIQIPQSGDFMNLQDLASHREAFRNDGVVCLRGAIDPASLRMGEEAFNWSLAHPGLGATKFSQDDASATFYQDLANPNAIAAYRRMLEDAPFADVVAALWGSRDVWFMYEQVFLKEGGQSRRTPWHQDSSYLPIGGDMLAVMWITFEAVAKEHSLEFVRGSHRGTLFNASRFDPKDDTAPLYEDAVLPRLPNIEAQRDRWDIVSWAVEPGDVLVFHPAMLHGGAPTKPGMRRRTLSLRFFGDDATYTPRPVDKLQAQRPPLARNNDEPRSVFLKLPETLRAGDPLRHPDFPKLRPRNSSS